MAPIIQGTWHDRRVILFVYGTLMRGEANHPLLARCRFLELARTEPGFELADLGPYPALVASGTGVVQGELFEVGAATLLTLDDFEGVPAHYERRVVLVRGPARGELLAYAYLMAPSSVAGCPRIASGSWRARAMPFWTGSPTEL